MIETERSDKNKSSDAGYFFLSSFPFSLVRRDYSDDTTINQRDDRGQILSHYSALRLPLRRRVRSRPGSICTIAKFAGEITRLPLALFARASRELVRIKSLDIKRK